MQSVVQVVLELVDSVGLFVCEGLGVGFDDLLSIKMMAQVMLLALSQIRDLVFQGSEHFGNLAHSLHDW